MLDAVLLDWNMPIMDGYEFSAICAASPAAMPCTQAPMNTS
jgi:CheY-like chemotaxis protein